MRPVLDEDKRYEFVDRERRYGLRDGRPFDRIAFAMRALDILRPSKMNVVVYERIEELRVERGPDRRRGPDASWAMVGIPPHASREHIAYELARLVGADREPWILATLIAEKEG